MTSTSGGRRPGRDEPQDASAEAPLYPLGLLGPGDRKSLQPMAARLGLPSV